jgi:Response regulators consisting of a CheY-like receiver domain and a winged-helix DNA-binding domain
MGKMIYVVEDHDVIRNGVVQYLALSGFEAKGYGDLKSAREAIEEQLPALVIQDVMLPDGDGFVFVKELKAKHPTLPVIFMTAREEESDRILGFELGCDDYITKPFSPKELVLRVTALFRRCYGTASGTGKVNKRYEESGHILTIDEERHKIFLDESEVAMTMAEWRILTFLAENESNLVTRGKILSSCFDYSFESYERVVDTHIKNIRAKLTAGAWIETVRGYGYRFKGVLIN